MKKLFMIVVTGCIFFAASGLVLSDQGVTDDSIKVGCITDFTGGAAVWGHGERLVGDMWAKEVNSTGGIHGRKVEIIWEDHHVLPDKALTAAKKLVNFDRIFCFIGGLGTAPNLVASEYAVKNKIPWIFPVNSMDKHANRVYKYVYNLLPTMTPITRVCVDYAVSEWNAKKFGVVYSYDDWGRGELKNVIDQLAKYGLEPAAVEHFKRGALEASAQVRRMRAAGCDVVNIVGQISTTASICKDAQKIGWRPHFLAGVAATNEKFIQLAGDAGNGVIGGSWFVSVDTRNKGMDHLRNLLKKYHPKVQISLHHLVWPVFAALEYALEETGRDLTVENFLKTCETRFNNWESGIVGPVTYGPDDHVGADSCTLRVVENGKFNKIPGWLGFITPKK